MTNKKMQLQEKFKHWVTWSLETELKEEKILTHDLGPDMPKIAKLDSLKAFQESQIFPALNRRIEAVTYGYEYGCYVDSHWLTGPLASKPFYRAILWNLDHGTHFSGILEMLRNRALVSGADIYFFPVVDVGMARSGNRNVVRNLAMELGYNYFFATSFVNVVSSGDGKNQLGIEGHAIMTRFPLSNLRVVPLENATDPLKSSDKRLGCEKALLADITTPHGRVTVVCLNFEFQSSQKQRFENVKFLMKKMREEERDMPVLLAGDFKTTNYNGKSPFWFFMSLVNKVFRGYDYIISDHHSQPEKYFERKLFEYLKKSGFDYESFNEIGKACLHLPVTEFVKLYPIFPKAAEWVERTMKKHSDVLQLKSDWFLGNSGVRVSDLHQTERPKVINHLYHEGRSVSPHDPVLLDFELKVKN